MEENDRMTWSNAIIELYCTRKMSEKKHKYKYKVTNFETLETKAVPNEKYDKDYKTPRKPWYCKGYPSSVCLEEDCPYMAYTVSNKEELTEVVDSYYGKFLPFIGSVFKLVYKKVKEEIKNGIFYAKD